VRIVLELFFSLALSWLLLSLATEAALYPEYRKDRFSAFFSWYTSIPSVRSPQKDWGEKIAHKHSIRTLFADHKQIRCPISATLKDPVRASR